MQSEETRSSFNLPTYDQLPAMGLYLKQVVDYLQECVSPFTNVKVTSSMVSNYVKHGLVDRPQQKRYSREQIAQLLFIVIAKNVLEQRHLRQAIHIQEDTYSLEVAYNYFAEELGNVTRYVFGYQKELQKVGQEHTQQKRMLRNLIMAFAYRQYLDYFFDHPEQR